MKLALLKLTALVALAASGVHAVDDPAALRGSASVQDADGNSDQTGWGWRDGPDCTSGCNCAGGGCNMESCTEDCDCHGGFCKMPKCKSDCNCYGSKCSMPVCKDNCHCYGGFCDRDTIA